MARISPEFLVFFLTFSTLLALLVMMLGIWGWALGRIWRGVPLLAEARTVELRQARWGALTVLAVILLYLVVNAAIFRAYAAATGRSLPRSVTQSEPHHEAVKPGKPPQAEPAVRPVEDPGKVAAEQSQEELMLQLAVINVLLIVLLPAVLRLTSGSRLADLGIDATEWKLQMARGFWAALLMIPAIIAVQGLAVRVWPSQKHPVELMVLEQFTPGVALLAIVSTVVLAPIIEEMLFRGIIQRWLSRLLNGRSAPSQPEDDDLRILSDLTGDWSPDEAGSSGPLPEPRSGGELVEVLPQDERSTAGSTLAIVLTSAFFAIMHLPQWPAPIAIFVLSMGLGALYRHTGSLLAAVVMHGTFNGFNTLLMLLEAMDHQMHPR